MTTSLPSQPDVGRPGSHSQFSLRAVLLSFVAVAGCLAVASYFPRESAFAFLMTCLLLLPLAIVATLKPLLNLFTIGVEERPSEAEARNVPLGHPTIRLLRLLGLWPPRHELSLVSSVAVAVISTMVVVGLWPALREIGLWMAVSSLRATETTWEYGLRSAQSTFSWPSYWLRLWEWELWSWGRWWLLFGAITALWLAGSSFNRRPAAHRSSHTLARWFAFAPWLIVLEVTFLIGVWIDSPNVVPEPSTGFVVGIFSWDLWRWDCWLDRGWLIRGALPTFIAGIAFFLTVLRWRWPAAVFAAAILIPIALMWSVACTVAYQNGLP